jgi:hypothetical protein
MSWWLILLIYITGAVCIGVPIARKSVQVWKKEEEGSSVSPTGGFWGFVLFPMTASEGKVGLVETFAMDIADEPGPCSPGPDDAWKRYVALSAMFWLPRIVFNLLAVSVITVFYALSAIAYGLFVGLPAIAGKLIRKT